MPKTHGEVTFSFESIFARVAGFKTDNRNAGGTTKGNDSFSILSSPNIFFRLIINLLTCKDTPFKLSVL